MKREEFDRLFDVIMNIAVNFCECFCKSGDKGDLIFAANSLNSLLIKKNEFSPRKRWVLYFNVIIVYSIIGREINVETLNQWHEKLRGPVLESGIPGLPGTLNHIREMLLFQKRNRERVDLSKFIEYVLRPNAFEKILLLSERASA
jgi:hypothetical protein